ncbi:MAG TPA: HD domain-containing protein [Spirochaetia bacterium]|nr:HD domain-containing protein [Spirochaetia bacterium]
MNPLMAYLDELPVPVFLSGSSALDLYFGYATQERLIVAVEGTLIDLARCFSNLEYPGIEGFDARLDTPEGRIYFTCFDPGTKPPAQYFAALNFLYDYRNRKFLDFHSVYWDLRSGELRPIGDGTIVPESMDWQTIVDASILIARYNLTPSDLELTPPSEKVELSAEGQRLLLELLLTGRYAKQGFAFLAGTGFVERHWPELARLDGINHSKAHHPEGNVWEHTLETFAYRKTQDLVLSLGLLFHDSGKPFAHKRENRMFDGHAEIGTEIARGFMKRLGFSEDVLTDVSFLVRQHMLPPYIAKLATYRTEAVMSNPLFPLLLELYRCDVSATYRGPDGYYEACKVYRRFLKNQKNPFRGADGKKLIGKRLLQLYVE